MDTQMVFIILVLPLLLGLSQVGEGIYKIFHFGSGWGSVILGSMFLALVLMGFFFLMGQTG